MLKELLNAFSNVAANDMKSPYLSQPAITCLKLTIETLEQGLKICSKSTMKIPERPCFSVPIVNFEQVNADWDYFQVSNLISFLFLQRGEVLFGGNVSKCLLGPLESK